MAGLFAGPVSQVEPSRVEHLPKGMGVKINTIALCCLVQEPVSFRR